VAILANPYVVQHYSENVVDTLHKKNFLLLGEDRYLSTLMLKTFPCLLPISERDTAEYSPLLHSNTQVSI
jgi:hypothetical protein